MNSEPKPAEPVNVLPVFRDERAALLDMLTGLAPKEWETDTSCPGWKVRDITAHLLGDDLGVLSRGRDEHFDHRAWTQSTGRTWSGIVARLNQMNERWVQATHHLSGRLLTELLGFAGELVFQYFNKLDPEELGDIVSWSGPDPAPHWLNIAREYTERWVHQAQIRRALHLPSLDEPRFLAPVIATFTRAFPRAYSNHQAEEGISITISVRGEAGGDWSLRRRAAGWELYQDIAPRPATSIRLDQEAFWRHLSRDDRSGVRERVEISGDLRLAEPFFDAVAVIAD